MRSTFFSLFLLVCAVSSHAVELVRAGRPAAAISLPDNASASVRQAATEMRKFILLATGAELPIKTAGQSHELPNTIKLGYGIDTEKLSNFAFVVQAEDKLLTIAGQDEMLPDFDAAELVGHGYVRKSIGTLLGVYDFLDKELKVRFLWPGELGTWTVFAR